VSLNGRFVAGSTAVAADAAPQLLREDGGEGLDRRFCRGVDAVILELRSDDAGGEVDDPPAAAQTARARMPLNAPFRLTAIWRLNTTSSLDRLLQRNQSGGFASGTQLYNYLKGHKCTNSNTRQRCLTSAARWS
jgi:hypothetical protein